MTGFKRFAVIAVILLIGSFGVSATAQDGPGNGLVSNPATLIPNFDAEHIGPILTELQFLWQSRQTQEGQPYILVNANPETVFVLSPLVCQGPGDTECVGLQMVSVFDGPADEEALRAFNNRYPFASVNINEVGNAYLNRYDVADYGIPRGNLATIIDTFASLSDIYQSTGASETASLWGDETKRRVDAAQHVSSMARAISQTDGPSAKTARAQTEAAFHLTSLMRAPDLPRNKIDNVRKGHVERP